MKTQLATLTLAVLGAMAMPSVSQAGNVGYIPGQTCSGGGDKTSAITAAGHTPVAVGAITPAALANLSALVVETCNAYTTNADINDAVNAGMGLVISDWQPSTGTGAQLPGAPAISYTNYGCISQIDLPPGSPAANGPGGALNNGSMDGGNCSAHGSLATASVPSGVQVLTTTDDPGQAVSLMYSHGSGKVIYAPLPWSWYIPGGSGTGNPAQPGIYAFMVNAIALAASGPTTTCASSGYSGTQLLWCVKICESGLSGKALDDWIHRWIRQFRQLPYCAVGGGNPPPPPQD